MNRQKLFDIISKAYFAIHCLWLCVILAASFCNIMGDKNLFGVFSPGFACIMLLWCAGICYFAFYSMKSPVFSVFMPFASFMFFCVLYLRLAEEAVIYGFLSIGSGSAAGTKLGIGYHIMSGTHYIMYLELAFACYAVIYLLRNRKNGKKAIKEAL